MEIEYVKILKDLRDSDYPLKIDCSDIVHYYLPNTLFIHNKEVKRKIINYLLEYVRGK